MSAEAYYFSQYSSEVSVPVDPVVSTPVHPAEAAYFAFYNTNCAPPSVVTVAPVESAEAPTAVQVDHGRPEIRQRPTQAAAIASVTVKAEGAKETEAVAVEAPWPSEVFDEVPIGTMSLGGFLDTLMKNMQEASTWKPAGYLKALAEKVFTFSVTSEKSTDAQQTS